MKTKFNISVILCTVLLISSIIISASFGESSAHIAKTVSSSTYDEQAEDNEEMRGLWVSYITLDMTGTDRSFESFKNKFNKITEEALKYKCNTLIVQARPFCDALYNSDIYPASHILSGTQGKYAGFDALEYMCEQAHNEGLKIHVWINPYRVSTVDTPEILSKDNPYVKNESLGITLESGIYLNPAKKATRKIVTQGVIELVKNYDIDGIQFDDYFYPTDIGNADAEEYNTYIKSLNDRTNALSLENWRKENINILIAEVYTAIKNIDNNILFGISPQGNISNNRKLYADIESWCEISGYIDYICPQMYFSTENPSLKFEECLKEWKNISYHLSLKVYIGLGAYKAGTDADSGTWLKESNILAAELNLLRSYGFDGYMIYDYSALEKETAQKELENFLSVID